MSVNLLIDITPVLEASPLVLRLTTSDLVEGGHCEQGEVFASETNLISLSTASSPDSTNRAQSTLEYVCICPLDICECSRHTSSVRERLEKFWPSLKPTSTYFPPQHPAFPTLPLSGKHVRLLRLDRELSDGMLRLTSQHYDLDQKLSFVALSYEWGDTSFSQLITVNGGLIEVRANLASFLDILRQKDNLGLIWCDMISINQDDHVEKGHQIGIMGRIFRNASMVYAWMGVTEWSFNALDFADLLHFKYWERLWIVQEFLLAKQLTLVVNSQGIIMEVSQDDFVRAFAKSQDFRDLLKFHGSRLSTRSLMKLLKYKELRTHRVPLLELVKTFKSSRCLDPRDKIYGLLSLAQESAAGNRALEVSYAKSNLEILFDTLVFVDPCPEDFVYAADLIADALEVTNEELETLAVSGMINSIDQCNFAISFQITKEGLDGFQPCISATAGDVTLYFVDRTCSEPHTSAKFDVFNDINEDLMRHVDVVANTERGHSLLIYLDWRRVAALLCARSTRFIFRLEETCVEPGSLTRIMTLANE